MILFIFEIDFNKMARWNLDTILEIDWTKIRKKLLKKNTFSFNVFVLNTLSVRKVSTHLEDHEKSAWYNIAAIRWQHHYTCVNFRLRCYLLGVVRENSFEIRSSNCMTQKKIFKGVELEICPRKWP